MCLLYVCGYMSGFVKWDYIEHGDPYYILDVLPGVINVSVKTMGIEKGLPKQIAM